MLVSEIVFMVELKKKYANQEIFFNLLILYVFTLASHFIILIDTSISSAVKLHIAAECKAHKNVIKL